MLLRLSGNRCWCMQHYLIVLHPLPVCYMCSPKSCMVTSMSAPLILWYNFYILGFWQHCWISGPESCQITLHLEILVVCLNFNAFLICNCIFDGWERVLSSVSWKRLLISLAGVQCWIIQHRCNSLEFFLCFCQWIACWGNDELFPILKSNLICTRDFSWMYHSGIMYFYPFPGKSLTLFGWDGRDWIGEWL